MKILNILIAENAMLDWRNNLTPMQSSVLLRVAQGKTMYETGSPREQATMDELEDMGYLSTMSNELTAHGKAVADIVAKHGSHDEFKMRRHPGPNSKIKGDGRFTDVGFRGEKNGDEDLALPLSGDALKGGAMYDKGRVNRDNSF